jgi:hypothetical protein
MDRSFGSIVCRTGNASEETPAIKKSPLNFQRAFCIKKTTRYTSGSMKPMAMSKNPAMIIERSANCTIS